MKVNSFSMPNAQEMQSLIGFCEVMAKSPFYQRLGAGGVMAIYLTAKEFDLPFMACLNGGLHTFDGKVTFSAIMIDALILKAGHTTEVLKLDDESCRIRFIRGDRKNDPNYEPFEFEYTAEKAKKAGYLTKNNWKSSLDDMLYCRCITGGGRKHIPEVFVGVLVSGELVGDDRDSNILPNLPSQKSLPAPKELVNKTYQGLAIEHVKKEGYDDFVKKHQLFEVDGKPTAKLEYILASCHKTGRPEIEIVNAAIVNEEGFENTFQKWNAARERESAVE